MFVFENNTIYLPLPKETVTKLRNMADLEKGTEKPNFHLIDVKNANGTHKGVGLVCKTGNLVIYYEESESNV